MREQLIPGSEGLYLQRTRSSNECAYSGDTIRKGQHAVGVRQEVDEYSYIVWVSVGSVDGLISSIETFDPETTEPKEELSPCGRVKYSTLHGNRQTCSVCEEFMDNGVDGVTLYNPSGNGTVVWIHLECCDRFVNGLETVWQYADDLLAEKV